MIHLFLYYLFANKLSKIIKNKKIMKITIIIDNLSVSLVSKSEKTLTKKTIEKQKNRTILN